MLFQLKHYSYNSHYEKLDGIERCIDDEIPFELPKDWRWVRFSEIALFENGDRSSKYPVETDYVPDGIPFFSAKDMAEKYMSFDDVRYISKEKFAQLGNGKLQNGDLICLLRGSVGKTRIFGVHRQGEMEASVCPCSAKNFSGKCNQRSGLRILQVLFEKG